VQKYLVFIFLFSVSGVAHAADNCGTVRALEKLKNPRESFELRSSLGTCLIQSHLDQAEVARAVLHIVNNSKEDLFLREDLIEALGNAQVRKTVSVEGNLAPKLGDQERAAVDRTIASASSLLAVSQAVKTMDETVPVSHYEADFFRSLEEIARTETNHVLFRAAAITALEKLSKRVVDSGVYDAKTIHLAQESLRSLASRDDNASYYSGAAVSYERLAAANLPGFVTIAGRSTTPNRSISSVNR
jgi:hypothetical protein